jgi:hypothetical protein
MIDNFALGVSHGLLLLAAWRLLFRPDLDDETAPAPAPPPPRDRRMGRKGA